MRNRGGGVGRAHVVGVVGQGAVSGTCGGTPSVAVDFVVVGVHASEVRVMVVAGEGVVRRHRPIEVGGLHGAAESEVLGGAVHAVAYVVEKPDAGEVDWHVDFFAGVGVIAEEPDFVVFAVDWLGPDFIDNHICGQFVFVAAVDHKLCLGIEGAGYTSCLWTSEVACRVCRCG